MTNVEFLAVILYTGLFMMLLQLMFMFAYFGPPRFMFNDDERTCNAIREHPVQETQDENNDPESFDTLEGVNYNEQNSINPLVLETSAPVSTPIATSSWSIW